MTAAVAAEGREREREICKLSRRGGQSSNVGLPPAGGRPTTPGNFTQTSRQLVEFQNRNYTEKFYIHGKPFAVLT